MVLGVNEGEKNEGGVVCGAGGGREVKKSRG